MDRNDFIGNPHYNPHAGTPRSLNGRPVQVYKIQRERAKIGFYDRAYFRYLDNGAIDSLPLGKLNKMTLTAKVRSRS